MGRPKPHAFPFIHSFCAKPSIFLDLTQTTEEKKRSAINLAKIQKIGSKKTLNGS